MAVFYPVAQVMFIVAVGYIFGKKFETHQKTISSMVLYVLGPALVFKGLYYSEMQGKDVLGIISAFLLVMLLLNFLSLFMEKLLKLPAEKKAAFKLSTTLVNLGNMGIQMVVYAFGEDTIAPAVLIYVIGTFYVNSVGVYTAGRGKKPWQQSLRTVLRMPTLYAALIAFFLNISGCRLPETMVAPVITLAGGTIPVMQLLLGIQLSKFQGIHHLKLVLTASSVRMLLSPVIAWIVALLLFKMPMELGKVFIVQMAMPTAVNATILSVEFDADAELAAGVTLVTTLMSILTLPALLWILQYFS